MMPSKGETFLYLAISYDVRTRFLISLPLISSSLPRRLSRLGSVLLGRKLFQITALARGSKLRSECEDRPES